jgi:hypothetical protein
MEVGDAREAKISMLKVLLQFGTSNAIKLKAQKELMAMAFGSNNAEEEEEVIGLGDDSDNDSSSVV